MDAVDPATADAVLQRSARHGLIGLVHVFAVAGLVGDEEADRRQRREGSEALLALADQVFRTAPVGDVDHRPLERRPALPADDAHGDMHPDRTAVLLEAHEFVAFRDTEPAESCLSVLPPEFAMLGSDEVEDRGQAEHFVDGVEAEHFGERGVGEHGLEIDVEQHTLSGSLDEIAEAFLAVAEGFLRLDPVGDVDLDAECRGFALPLNRHAAREHEDRRAVEASPAELGGFERLAMFRDGLHAGLERLEVVRIRHVDDRPADNLLGR